MFCSNRRANIFRGFTQEKPSPSPVNACAVKIFYRTLQILCGRSIRTGSPECQVRRRISVQPPFFGDPDLLEFIKAEREGGGFEGRQRTSGHGFPASGGKSESDVEPISWIRVSRIHGGFRRGPPLWSQDFIPRRGGSKRSERGRGLPLRRAREPSPRKPRPREQIGDPGASIPSQYFLV
jgi:hypothetical protein